MKEQQAIGASGLLFSSFASLSSANNLVTLRELMLELRPFGRSCLVFAADLGHSPAQQHVAIDPFQHEVWDDCGLRSLEESQLADYVDFSSYRSCIKLPRLLVGNREFDLICIDGSQPFEEVILDCYYSIRLLKVSVVVAFDDSANPRILKILKFLRRTPLGLNEFNLDAFRVAVKSRLRYRLGCLFGRNQFTAFRRDGPVDRSWNSRFVEF